MNRSISFRKWQVLWACLLFMTVSLSMQAAEGLSIQNLGEGYFLVRVRATQKYLLLPVEEAVPDARVSMIVDNREVNYLDVRLAVNKVDYFVPLDLSAYAGKEVVLRFKLVSNDPVRVTLSPDNATCCKEMKLADDFDVSNREKFRPAYHFTPQWGWMNDPNGMVYKDGEYHLFFQYNPYGSKWGNMQWGHAISKDLVHWDHYPVAIAPDAFGTIFSGSAVVDHNNTAGFGKDAIVAIYTQNSDRQMQSIAYSTDNGRTFTKYENNPVLTSDAKDFRDPKVFWYEGTKRWTMILAVGQEMQIYSSPDLKDWTFESSFGKGQGAHGNVWECPDLFEIPVEGTTEKRWVLLCNIGDGPFGDSATQYFVGTFDGKTFTNESPSLTKWMDWGKDHYATVTWSDAPDNRRIALAWMSNWQYANDVPTMQFRSSNSVPRDLSLFKGADGELYLKSAPSPELLALRGTAKKRSFKVKGTRSVKDLLPVGNAGTYEIELVVKNQNAGVMGFRLYNDKGEEVDMRYDLGAKRFSMDRRKSGMVSFNENFPTVTWTALEETDGEMTLRLFVDKASVEAFGNGGRFAMTNLVFPTEPYGHIDFYSEGGAYKVESFQVYPLQ